MRDRILVCALAVVVSVMPALSRGAEENGPVSPTRQAPSPATTNAIDASSLSSSPTVSAAKARTLVQDDVVEVKVYRHADLDTKTRIAQDGSISLPLLGSVKIGGMTVEQAGEKIRQLLAKDYLVNPQVGLSVIEYAKRTFTILGEVQRPGTYEMPANQSINLLQAIALAGGYTRIGSPGKVILQRVEGGQNIVRYLDAASMATDARAKSFEILPNDSITVGEKFF